MRSIFKRKTITIILDNSPSIHPDDYLKFIKWIRFRYFWARKNIIYFSGNKPTQSKFDFTICKHIQGAGFGFDITDCIDNYNRWSNVKSDNFIIFSDFYCDNLIDLTKIYGDIQIIRSSNSNDNVKFRIKCDTNIINKILLKL
jgi:hypothetical protein